MRPVNKCQYENVDTLEFAGVYVFGLAKAHAFVDVTRRTAFVTGVAFLRSTKWHFVTKPAEGVEFIEGLASDYMSEEFFKFWCTHGSTKIIQGHVFAGYEKPWDMVFSPLVYSGSGLNGSAHLVNAIFYLDGLLF